MSGKILPADKLRKLATQCREAVLYGDRHRTCQAGGVAWLAVGDFERWADAMGYWKDVGEDREPKATLFQRIKGFLPSSEAHGSSSSFHFKLSSVRPDPFSAEKSVGGGSPFWLMQILMMSLPTS